MQPQYLAGLAQCAINEQGVVPTVIAFIYEQVQFANIHNRVNLNNYQSIFQHCSLDWLAYIKSGFSIFTSSALTVSKILSLILTGGTLSLTKLCFFKLTRYPLKIGFFWSQLQQGQSVHKVVRSRAILISWKMMDWKIVESENLFLKCRSSAMRRHAAAFCGWHFENIVRMTSRIFPIQP